MNDDVHRRDRGSRNSIIAYGHLTLTNTNYASHLYFCIAIRYGLFTAVQADRYWPAALAVAAYARKPLNSTRRGSGAFALLPALMHLEVLPA